MGADGRPGMGRGVAAEGKLLETQAEFCRRTEHVLILLEDRARWPGDAMRIRPSHTTRDLIIQFVLIVFSLALLLWWATS